MAWRYVNELVHSETRLHKFKDLRMEQKSGRLNPRRIYDLRECITLGIPTICLTDTNCDPISQIFQFVNDDAISSIRLILNKLRARQYECSIMFHQYSKGVIRYIRCGSRPTFLLANRGFPSTWPTTIAVRNPQTIPTGVEFLEYVLEFIRDVSKTQIGEEYGPGSFTLENHTITSWELAAPTNDINTLLLWLYSHPWHISMVPLVVPIPVMLLGLFTSGIQALIFATLAAAYIGLRRVFFFSILERGGRYLYLNNYKRTLLDVSTLDSRIGLNLR
ncbi:hypothetical protein R3W88_030171 [Solanum pinnatisectum]|uniref:Uncharacterized protein n=1 Tax=Solanum pinnatisectum TaxID=50273 RepID=A0AAV9K7D2_9SOLN|nr:hypothetical protein R3W88_030171 [Solanum pinnatisectum]